MPTWRWHPLEHYSSEATVSQVPSKLRMHSGIMLYNSNLAFPLTLWTNHCDNLSQHILHQHLQHNSDVQAQFDKNIFIFALILLKNTVLCLDGNKLHYYGLPTPQRTIETVSQEILRETNCDVLQLTCSVRENELNMVEDQWQAYDEQNIEASTGIFFLDTPGWTGKTFISNVLLAIIHQDNHIAWAVASSGITATLVAGQPTLFSSSPWTLHIETMLVAIYQRWQPELKYWGNAISLCWMSVSCLTRLPLTPRQNV